MKHTPGPWRLTVGEYGCKRIGPDRPGHQRGIMEVCATVGLFDEEQDKANARLIAAAPELLEALEDAVDTVIWMSGAFDFSPEGIAHEGWLKVHPRIAGWKVAIAKARGES